jgi:hypothetical protein
LELEVNDQVFVALACLVGAVPVVWVAARMVLRDASAIRSMMETQ